MSLPTVPLINKRIARIVNQSVNSLAEVDDELERSRRRSESDTQRPTPAFESPKSPQLSNEREIREHFEICLKLYAQNKISKKNVWKLKMVDCMVQSQTLTRNSLHVASTSLDVSAKIYGLRVDSIHTAGLEIANNLARSGDASETDFTEKDNTKDDADWNIRSVIEGVAAQKSAIAKNPQSLLSDVPKLLSVFFQTRLDPEAPPLQNLVTAKLLMNHGRYKYMLLSKEKAWPRYGKRDPNVDFQKSYPLNISKVKNLQICAPFADFEVDEWNPDDDQAQFEATNTPIEDEVVYDLDGIPIPELDGSIHDLFDISREEDDIRLAQAQTHRVANKIVDFRSNESCSGPNNHSNLRKMSKRITQAWAGPKHWKLKHVRQTKIFGRLQRQAKRNRKAQSNPPLINFHEEVPRFDRTNIYKKKPCQIDISPSKCNLPHVMQSKSGVFGFLMLKHVFLDNHAKPNEDEENVEDVELHPHGNEDSNGSQCFFREELDDNNNQSPNNGGEGKTETEMIIQNDFDPNSLQVPELVPKTCYPYAFRTNKIDMAKLKIAVWKSLVRNHPDEKIPQEGMYEREVKKKKFSYVFKDVSDNVSRKMKEELSYHLGFVVLLHVATRHNLHLTGQCDLADFTIESATTK